MSHKRRSLSTSELTDSLGVTRRTVRNWAAAGCPHQGGGRGKAALWDKAEVRAWLQARSLTSQELAEALLVTRRTVRNWAAGDCPHSGGGRGRPAYWNREEVEAWLESASV